MACDQPAKMLVEVQTQADPRHAIHQAMPATISPQTSVKLVGGYGTSAEHMLAMAFDDPTMDDDLRWTPMRLFLGRSGPMAGPVLAWSVPLRAMMAWNSG